MDAINTKNLSRVSELTFLVAAATAFGAVQPARAANNTTESYYEIRDLIFWSNQEPIFPAWAGYVSVAFTQSLVWLTPGVCDTATVAIRPEDKHMMAAVQAALASEKPLRLYVDDSQKLSGNVCILRAVQY